MRPLDRPLALIGLMGAGKTSVAQCLGERLAVPVADLDAWVEAEAGLSIAELFDAEGEPSFRRRERRALEQALAGGVRVLACGGGVVLDPIARERLRECHTVWLEVSAAEAARRLGATDVARRPMLQGRDTQNRLSELLTQRGELYRDSADARVVTDGASVEQVADRVLEAIEGHAP